jgi:hypothetical protein
VLGVWCFCERDDSWRWSLAQNRLMRAPAPDVKAIALIS